jgi:hypothetical protein
MVDRIVGKNIQRWTRLIVCCCTILLFVVVQYCCLLLYNIVVCCCKILSFVVVQYCRLLHNQTNIDIWRLVLFFGLFVSVVCPLGSMLWTAWPLRLGLSHSTLLLLSSTPSRQLIGQSMWDCKSRPTEHYGELTYSTFLLGDGQVEIRLS